MAASAEAHGLKTKMAKQRNEETPPPRGEASCEAAAAPQTAGTTAAGVRPASRASDPEQLLGSRQVEQEALRGRGEAVLLQGLQGELGVSARLGQRHQAVQDLSGLHRDVLWRRLAVRSPTQRTSLSN